MTLQPDRSFFGAEVFERSFRRDFLQAQRHGKCFIKHVNLFTGFGKTHSSAKFAIDTLRSFGDVYSIFLVPTQAIAAGMQENLESQPRDWSDQYVLDLHLAGAASGAKVPIYRIFSMEYLRKDKIFHTELVKFGDYLRSNPDLLQAMKAMQTQKDVKSPHDHVASMISSAKGCLNSPVMVPAPEVEVTDENESQFESMGKAAYSDANWLMSKLVRLRLAGNSSIKRSNCFGGQVVTSLYHKLLPMQAFIEQPGIIVTTASKAMTQFSLCFASESGKVTQETFESLSSFVQSASKPDTNAGKALKRSQDAAQFMVFIDEEEESYWYTFDGRLSEVNKEGDNDLNEVLSQFLRLNDINLHSGFSKVSKALALKIYHDIKAIAEISSDFMDALCRAYPGVPFDDIRADRLRTEYRAVARNEQQHLDDDYSDSEIDHVVRYILDQDGHASFVSFRRKAAVIEALKPFVSSLPGAKNESDADKLSGLFENVMNKKYFTMNRVAYGEVLDQPLHTFFSDNLSVMSTDFLKRMRVISEPSVQTLVLQYEDGPVDTKHFTLFHYVQLLLVISRLLADERFWGGTIPQSKQSSYRDLMSFKKALRQTYKSSIIEAGMDQLTFDDEIVDDSFVYESLKSVISLRESRRQNLEYNAARDIALTVTLSALKKTPENDIDQYLGTRNGVYLMSATGGLKSASSGAFNMQQMQTLISRRDGMFFEMSEEEIKLVLMRREHLAPLRARHVKVFETFKPEAIASGSTTYSFLSKQLLKMLQEGSAPQVIKKLKNGYKVAELKTIIASLDELARSEISSGLVLAQSLAMFKPALRKMADSGTGLIEMVDNEGDVFLYHHARLAANAHLADKRPVRIVLYRANRFASKGNDRLDFEDAADTGQFSAELKEALDTKDAKVCLVSAYKSASRGLNFYVTVNGREQDFEMMVMANDPYYTRHTRSNSNGFSMEGFQSYCQVRKDLEGDGHQGITQSELLYLYQRNSWALLEKEHYIEILRVSMQGLGRIERRPEIAPANQFIYIANDAAFQIHLGLKHAQELIQRASLTQLAVFQAIDDYMTCQAIFDSPDALRAHYRHSKRLVRDFRKLCKENSRDFRDPESNARDLWEARFDERMFTDPRGYMQMLFDNRQDDERFILGCYFVRSPNTAMFVTNVDLDGEPLEVRGQPFEIITNHRHGTSIYEPLARIANHSLLSCMSSRSQKLMDGLRHAIEPNDKGERFVPQPWFVTDILKGFIAEIEFEELIGEHLGIKRQVQRKGRRVSKQDPGHGFSYLEPLGHEHEAALYQLFDYYLEMGGESLVAIDIKNWAPKTDRYRSEELIKRAEEKLATLKRLFPDKKIRTLYVNLQGVEKISIPPKRQGEIQFFSMYVRKGKAVSDTSEDTRLYRVNSNFINAIRQMEGNHQ